MASKPFISQLLDDLATSSFSLTESLRKARLAAARLKLDSVARWIELELKGYEEAEDLPAYRLKQGLPQAYNPYHGWQPILSKNHDFIAAISKAPIGSPIGVIESDIRNRSDGDFLEFAIPAEKRNQLSMLLEFPTNVRLLLSPNASLEIYEAVRNLLTDWCLELERSGVTGAGVTFADDEKRAAPAATERFVIHNYGSIGNIVGSAQQSTLSAGNLSADQIASLKNLSEQIARLEESLPSSIRDNVAQLNSELSNETAKASADPKRISEVASSLRKIAESASGNLTAQGILATLRAILGA